MTRLLRRAILALAGLALCAGLLAACGSEEQEQTPAEQLRQTFGASTTAIDDARMNLSFRLDPEGLLAIGGPIGLTLDGPFAAPRTGELPRFDVDFAALLGGQDYRGSVLSTGKRAYTTLDDGTYKVDAPFVDRLRDGLRSQAQGGRGLSALGIDPLRWISGATRRGEQRIGGVDTVRIAGKVNVERLLADLDGLLTKAGGTAGGPSLLDAKLRKHIAGAVSAATVNVWTGASDKLVRQLTVKIVFFFELGQSPVAGLNGGTINLKLRLDDVNEGRDVAFAVPAGTTPRPIARLTGGSVTNIMRGIGAGLTGGQGRELFRCLTGADGSSSALLRCISRLAP